MPGRRALILVAGAILGALFLYLAAHKLDWQAARDALLHAHPRAIAACLGCLLAYYATKAMRWRFLVAPFARASTRELLPAVLAGLAGNYAFPHVGEIPRVVLAGRRLGAPPGALLGSIAIERFFDFLALLALVLAVLLPLGTLDRDVRAASWFVAALSAALLAMVTVFVVRTEACIALAHSLITPFSPRLAQAAAYHLRQARVGLGAISRPRLLLPVFGLSLLQWLAVIGCVFASLQSVGMAVPLAGAASVLLLNVIGLTLPAAPGHVGTVQLAFVVGLAPFSVPQEQVFAASVVYNVMMVVPTVLLGLPGLRHAGAALRERLAAG